MLLLLMAAAASQPAPAPAAKKDDSAKIICHIESSASSRIPDRVCHTKAEWEQMEKDTRDDIQNARRFGNYGDPTPH